MKKELVNKLVAVVRIRGGVNVRSDIKETLARLNLPHVNNCSIIKATPSYLGMINKCNNYIAYGEIEDNVLSMLLKAKGIEGIDLKQPDFEKKLKESMPLKLHPPKRGYTNIKKGFAQGGDLGYMGTHINSLIKRMV
jgi:large subunit ribosomal protein L30